MSESLPPAMAEIKRQDKEITRLQSEVERLRGRCGELESDNKYVRARDDHLISFLVNEAGLDMVSVKAVCGHIPDQDAWLLRKQAEAVESARDETCSGSPMTSWHWRVLTDYAQRLRQQSAESENGAITRKAD